MYTLEVSAGVATGKLDCVSSLFSVAILFSVQVDVTYAVVVVLVVLRLGGAVASAGTLIELLRPRATIAIALTGPKLCDSRALTRTDIAFGGCEGMGVRKIVCSIVVVDLTSSTISSSNDVSL